LLSLMAMLLLGGMHIGLRVWESGGERQDFGTRLERTDGFLGQLLGQASLLPAAPSPRGFLGEPQRLQFAAPLPYQLGSGGNFAFDLAVSSDDAPGALVLRWRPLDPASVSHGRSNQTVLLPDVQALGLAYFGQQPGERQPAWHDSWSGKDWLPALIRLDLTMSAARSPDRLSVYVALRLSANAS
jgi:general secretion pathway protein J